MFKLKYGNHNFFCNMFFLMNFPINVVYYFLFVYFLSMFLFSFIKQLKILIHWLLSIIFLEKLRSGHKAFALLVSPNFFNFLIYFYLDGPHMFLHWHILLLYPKALKLISMMSSCLCLQIDRPKKLLILNVNELLCYFLHSTIWNESAWMFGKNINMNKMEVRTRMQHFFFHAFKYF
jgi:hypothetical protein